jgi:hypothetical protein
VREVEQLAERCVREDLVPAVVGADHAVPEAERGDGELERHRRDAVRGRVDLEDLAALVEDGSDHGGRDDPRQVVGANHPLVVLGDDLARLSEALGRWNRARERVDHRVMEADQGEVDLRDREVLVVPRVGNDRFAGVGARRHSRKVETLARVRPTALCRANLEVHVVAIELRRARVLRAVAVQRVEIETW